MHSFKMNIDNSILATHVEGVGEDLSLILIEHIHEGHRILGEIKLQHSNKTKTSWDLGVY